MAATAMNFEFGELLGDGCTFGPPQPRGRGGQSFHHQRAPAISETFADSAKNRYSEKVLVGYWFDRRSDYEPPAPDYLTNYRLHYPCKLNLELENDREARQKYKSRIKEGVGSRYLIECPGKAFQGNYMTTNNLFFRIFPKGLCGPEERTYSSRKGEWVPQQDLSKNYGKIEESCPDLLAEEIARAPQKRFPRKKGNFDEPYLEHLDINPYRPFKPHLVKTSDCCH
ncbi:hypothetical protein QAD02_018619 [Eretmocerus hayati]|uniref:Uncharacterized protein n=1 Tax=Eretmocerus hayati TaxID=131215 RepID=A0ACC2PKA2_9HYME|nr:hypothetical protein QAD02_018619 [Eretmocerus hayati]